eukprot:m51a1_g4880 hypothetical protein (784) ;mRNA; f:25976-34952
MKGFVMVDESESEGHGASEYVLDYSADIIAGVRSADMEASIDTIHCADTFIDVALGTPDAEEIVGWGRNFTFVASAEWGCPEGDVYRRVSHVQALDASHCRLWASEKLSVTQVIENATVRLRQRERQGPSHHRAPRTPRRMVVRGDSTVQLYFTDPQPGKTYIVGDSVVLSWEYGSKFSSRDTETCAPWFQDEYAGRIDVDHPSGQDNHAYTTGGSITMLQVIYQDGYGIVNMRLFYGSAAVHPMKSYSHGNLGRGWMATDFDGNVITVSGNFDGMQFAYQSGYGIVNVRLHTVGASAAVWGGWLTEVVRDIEFVGDALVGTSLNSVWTWRQNGYGIVDASCYIVARTGIATDDIVTATTDVDTGVCRLPVACSPRSIRSSPGRSVVKSFAYTRTHARTGDNASSAPLRGWLVVVNRPYACVAMLHGVDFLVPEVSAEMYRVMALENDIPVVVVNRYGETLQPTPAPAAFDQETFVLNGLDAADFWGAETLVIARDGTIAERTGATKDVVVVATLDLGASRHTLPVVRRPELYSLIAHRPIPAQFYGLPDPAEFTVAAVKVDPSNDTRPSIKEAINNCGGMARLVVLPAGIYACVGADMNRVFEEYGQLAGEFNLDIAVTVGDTTVLRTSDGRAYEYTRVHSRSNDNACGIALGSRFVVVDRPYARVALLHGVDFLVPEALQVLSRMGVDVVAVAAADDSKLLELSGSVRAHSAMLHVVVANSRGKQGVYRGDWMEQIDRVEDEHAAVMHLSSGTVRDKSGIVPQNFDASVLLRRDRSGLAGE